MEANSQFFIEVSNCLLNSLNPQTQKEAEQRLSQFETTIPNFPCILLSLTVPEYLSRSNIPPHVGIPSILLLKNLIKKHWANTESLLFTQSVRVSIKNEIFSCISQTSSNNVRIQLGEIIVIIAQFDFPENWSDLIDKLLERIIPTDFAANLAILKTCHYIFKRYRLEERSDDLYREINYVMSKFGPSLLEIFTGIEKILTSNCQDIALISLIIQNATYANKIFYSLSFQDIPEFIEDHLGQFMNTLMFLYNYQNKSAGLVTESEEQPGICEKLTASVAKIVILYASKYEEDFGMLNDFAQATWNILTTRVSLLQKDDKIAYTCMGFLSSIARQERHKTIFQNTLQIICDNIIIPNMAIRESDLETFEDDPIEFIKRDSEGSSEISHRHESAVALIRGLVEFHEVEMTRILFEIVQKCLLEYSSGPIKNWRSKLLATQVFSAIGSRGYAENYGVTRTNSLVNISDYYNSHVLSDLHSSNEGLHPLLKLEAIKFVTNYRNQLTKDNLIQCLPFLLHHLESKNYIIHTYAAIAVEKVLSVKRSGENVFVASDVSSLAGRLSFNILALIFNHRTIEKMCENHFLIKAFMRVLGLAGNAEVVDSVCRKFLERIIWLLNEIIKNPINPFFTHYLFESFALMIRISGGKPETFFFIETHLVPSLFTILQSDQTELFPYAFQILTVLIEFNPSNAGLSDYIKSLLPVIYQLPLWSVSSNVPALVRFLQASFSKEPVSFSTPQVIESVLAIFKLLVNSKVNDVHGFNLLASLFSVLPSNLSEKYVRPVFLLILNRVQAHKTQRLCSAFLLFYCHLIVESNIPNCEHVLLQILNQIQPNLYVMIFKSLFMGIIYKIQEPNDKILVLFGVFRTLLALQSTIQGASNVEESSLWFAILSEVIKSFLSGERESSVTAATAAVNVNGCDLSDDVATTGNFNRLISVPKVCKYSKSKQMPQFGNFLLQQCSTLGLDQNILFSRLDLDESFKGKFSLFLQKYS